MANEEGGRSPADVVRGRRRTGGRTGGRAARVAARQESRPDAVVWPGVEGGAFKPLAERDIQRIHEAALHILETVGIGDPSPELIDIVVPKGCFLNDHGRLCFPPALIEDLIAGAAKDYVVYARGARTPSQDVHSGGRRVHFCTAGSAVTSVDFATRSYRSSTLVDIYDLVRLIDQSVASLGSTP